MKTFLSLIFLTSLILSIRLLASESPGVAKPAEKAAEKPVKEKPTVEETRELLAEHETIAKLSKVEFRKCMGRTSLCPDQCGHSGNFATFDITTYLSYKKPGQYGDEKTKSYLFQIDDNLKNPKLTKEMAEAVNALQPGDTVLLSWRHDYVTRKEGGGSSKFPDRPLTKLQKITPEEAEQLAKKAAK